MKSSRISEVIGTSRASFLYGENQPSNYNQYLQAYGDETWVYICVYLISTTIAGTPWRIVKEKRTQEGLEYEEVYDKDLYYLLKNINEVDANSTWSSLIEFTVANQELTGNAYWLLDEIIGDIPSGILPLISSRVTIKQSSGDKLIDGYTYSRNDGQFKTYPAEEVLHFRYTNPANYFYGQGSFSAGRVPVETHSGSMESNKNLFRNGSIGLQVLTTDQSLTAENFNRLRAQIKDNYMGKQNAHKFLILENGLKRQDGGVSAKERTFAECSEFRQSLRVT
jgi:HK97 family phage portal protein